MALDPQLLEILACPDTHHAPLDYDAGGQTLTCTQCGRVFEVRDDIPILLLDDASVGSATPGPGAAPDRDGGDSLGPDSAAGPGRDSAAAPGGDGAAGLGGDGAAGLGDAAGPGRSVDGRAG